LEPSQQETDCRFVTFAGAATCVQVPPAFDVTRKTGVPADPAAPATTQCVGSPQERLITSAGSCVEDQFCPRFDVTRTTDEAFPALAATQKDGPPQLSVLSWPCPAGAVWKAQLGGTDVVDPLSGWVVVVDCLAVVLVGGTLVGGTVVLPPFGDVVVVDCAGAVVDVAGGPVVVEPIADVVVDPPSAFTEDLLVAARAMSTPPPATTTATATAVPRRIAVCRRRI
jgi:hypothetical protein